MLGRRGSVVLLLLGLAVVAWLALDLRLGDLVPRAGGAMLAKRFFAAALRPAWDYEGSVPPGAGPFLLGVLEALRRTFVFAAAAMSLAIVGGLGLGILASSCWWSSDSADARGWRRRVGPVVQTAVRVLIALLRSVHELLWAVVLLAALGLTPTAAVIALALPFTGTLAKVFSELFDEAPREAARALAAAGGGPTQVFVAATLPRALPDMWAYTFYRFECAVRSSAILGFFGFETLGYHLRLSFENVHYREVWTYLYTMLAVVLLFEAWSAAQRRRFVA